MISLLRRNRLLTLVVAVALVVAVGVLAVRSSAVRHQFSLSFTRQDAPLVELFFDQPDRITAAAGGVFPEPLTFAVRNRGSDELTEPYSVSLRSGSSVLLEYNETVRVAGHETATEQVRLPVPQGVTDYTVSITLTKSDRVIFFHGTVR